MAQLIPFILSIAAIVSITCLFCILLLHFSVHFRFRRCRKPSKTLSHRSIPMLPNIRKSNARAPMTPMSASPDAIQTPRSQMTYSFDTRCQNCIVPTDEETFEFFPLSFISYLVLTIGLTALILYKLLETDTLFHDFNSNQSILHFLPIVKHENNRNYLFSLRLHLSLRDYALRDWILVYSQIILSIWDSIFSFYRYYTTMHCANYFQLLSLQTTLKYFCVYGVPYVALSILQIHVYYFLFPLIIIAHLTMNFWCNWMFAKILIDSTLQYTKAEEVTDNITIHNEMLHSVYFMRRTSMVWCCISVLCHSLFIITYDVDILCCYPLLWCIGTLLFALNFVRNRTRLFQESFKIYRAFKHCSFNEICSSIHDHYDSDSFGSRLVFVNNNNNTLRTRTPQTKGTNTSDESMNTNGEMKKTDESSTNINMESRSTVKSTEIKSSATHHMMHSVDEEEEDRIGDLDVFVEDEEEIMIYEYDDPISLMALNRNMQQQQRKSVSNMNNNNNGGGLGSRARANSMKTDVDKKRKSTNHASMNMQHIHHMTSASDPIDILAKMSENNQRNHQLMPTMDLGNVLAEEKEVRMDIDLYGEEDEEEEEFVMEDEEENDMLTRKRGNKALELLGIAATKHEIRRVQLTRKVASVSRSNTGTELPPATAIFGHRRSQSMGHIPTSHSDFTLDDTKFNVVIDKIDEIAEENEESNNEMISEITHKLEAMMQRKSEVNPTILRRLDYQTKVAATASHTNHKRKLHLKRSLSAPSSPRRIAQYLGLTNYNNHENYVEMKSDKEDEEVEMNLPQEEEVEFECANNLLTIPSGHMHGLKLVRTGSVPLQPYNSPKENELTRSNSFNYNHRSDYDHNTLQMTKPVHRQAASMNHDVSSINIQQKVATKGSNKRRMKQKSTGDTLVLGFNALVLHGFYSRKSLVSVQQLTQLKMKNKKHLSAIKE